MNSAPLNRYQTEVFHSYRLPPQERDEPSPDDWEPVDPDEADTLAAQLAAEVAAARADASHADGGYETADAWAAADTAPARLHCERCGYTWSQLGTAAPTYCAGCRTRFWRVPLLPARHCVQCGYTWTPRYAAHSPCCPWCHTSRWDGRPSKRTGRPPGVSPLTPPTAREIGCRAAQDEHDGRYAYRAPYPHTTHLLDQRRIAWLAGYTETYARLMREDSEVTA